MSSNSCGTTARTTNSRSCDTISSLAPTLTTTTNAAVAAAAAAAAAAVTTTANLAINFTGLTHDHTQMAMVQADEVNGVKYCSTIAILRRHPMYDCLMLVKKYRNCLRGYSLEFPSDVVRENELEPTSESPRVERPFRQQQQNSASRTSQLDREDGPPCSGRRLVSRFFDGDDPIFEACCQSNSANVQTSIATRTTTSNNSDIPNNNHQNHRYQYQQSSGSPFIVQVDDRGVQCELVHVPINGLMDRLANYTRQGIAIDSRVYAFAIGLKTAERLMTTKSMKELQESPL